jgi:hypothetical protein
MFARIKTGWNLPRVMFLLMGGYICFESIATSQWIGVFPGLYFGTMGLLGLGCAGGNCAVPVTKSKPTDSNQEVVESYVEIESHTS